MTERRFQIENIPAVLYGDASEKAYLFIHGQCGCKEEGLAFAEIATDFGQTLSWNYLTWERQHPIQNWNCPTAILYAGQDNMTSRETVERFVTAHDAALTVMENGEHWFHTPEQLAMLRAWKQENI